MPHLVRIVIQLPVNIKTQLDNLKQQGYTTSGFIRAVLERELATKVGKPVTPFPFGKQVR
jgi:mannitol/fructose-specific phosphotransferase system IIA component